MEEKYNQSIKSLDIPLLSCLETKTTSENGKYDTLENQEF